jgi:DNA-binding transcriptional LysR family regulator
VVAWEFVRQGLGLAIMADEIAARFPEIVPAFSDIEPVSFPIWLVTHRELHTSQRIRVVFDHLAEGLLKAKLAKI